MTYPLVEPFLVAWHTATGLSGRAVSELPGDPSFTASLPLVQYERIGGLDPVLSLDEATVSVDVYATTRLAAYTLAEQVRTALRKGHYSAAGTVLARVRTISAPSSRPTDNTTVRRVGATYLITLHTAV